MTIYIVVWGVVVLCCLLEQVKVKGVPVKRVKALSFWICFVALLLLGLFRNEMLGVDVEGYKLYYQHYGNVSVPEIVKSLHGRDVGFYMLGNLVYNVISTDFYIFKCIIYCFSLGTFGHFVRQKSENPALSFIIYMGLGFLNYNFCLLRQSIAIPLCLFAYMKWEDGEKKASIISYLLAISFHSTAILFGIIYVLGSGKYRSIRIWKKIVIQICFVLGSMILMPLFVSFYRDGLYSESFVLGQGAWLLVFYLVVFMMSWYLISHSKANRNQRMQFNVSCNTVYFQSGALFFSLFTRMVSYFSIYFAFLVPNSCPNIKNKKIWALCFIVLFSFLYLYGLITNDCDIVPYVSIWERM